MRYCLLPLEYSSATMKAYDLKLEDKKNETSLYFKKILEELIRNEEIDIHGRYFNVRDSKKIGIGDYTFVLLKRHLSYDNTLSIYEKSIMDGYNILNSWSLSADKAYGLDSSNVYIEQVPLVIHPAKHIINLKRVYDKET